MAEDKKKEEIIKMEDTSTSTDGGGDGGGGAGVFPFSDNMIPNGFFDFSDGDKCCVGFMELLGLNDCELKDYCSEVFNPPATPNCSSSVSSVSTSDAVNDDDPPPPPPPPPQQHNPTNKQRMKVKKRKEKKEKEARYAFMTKSEVDHLEDGYRWRKYGQKAVKNSPFPRSYYRCTSAACNVKKRVERSFADPSVVVTTYEGQHTHPSPILTRSTLAVAIQPPLPTGAPGEGCISVAAMPWLKSTHNAHDDDIIPALSHQYFQNSIFATSQHLDVDYNRNNHIGAVNAAGIFHEKQFCNPNSTFLVDHGLLQDVVPPHMLKQD